jgi:hypothetical protein
MQGVVLLGPSAERLASLAALSSLQHLHAQSVQHAPYIWKAFNYHHKLDSGRPLLPRRLLSQLQQLTYLHVDGGRLCPTVSAAGLQDISRLTRLQHLGLSLTEQVTEDDRSSVVSRISQITVGSSDEDGEDEDDGLPNLPPGLFALTQLTYLMLTSFNGASLPNLAPLPLQHLHLSLCGHLRPADLTELTGLQHLHLEGFRLPGYWNDPWSDAAKIVAWLKQQLHMTS